MGTKNVFTRMSLLDIKLEQFSGPLDLLLSLIAEEKLDITTIALSHVTEQYLQYLEQAGEKNADELADFLVVATRLLLLKSRALIPQLSPEPDDGPSLEAQLRLYKVFVDVSKKIQRLWLSPNRGEWRIEPLRRAEAFVPPDHVDLARLHGTMVQLINRLRPPKALPRTVIDKSVSVQEKIDYIRELFRRVKACSFHEMMNQSRSRTEIIVSFMAVLELMKQQVIIITQEEQFGDILIKRC